MKTLYDIGDEIEIRLIGRIKEYRVTEDGDCYTIELTDPKQKRNRVYLTSEDLTGTSSKISVQDPQFNLFLDL